jgi:hypothetical protein
MVARARKLLGSALGLALAGSLLGGPTATAGVTEGGVADAEIESFSYTYTDLAVAPNTAPAGSPVQVHGYVGEEQTAPSRGRSVTISFNPAGTSPRRAVATVTTDDDGWFAKEFRPRTSGTFDIVAAGSGDVVGQSTAKFTVRPTGQPVRTGVVSGTKNGYTAKARVIAQDVVTRAEPQTVYLDAAILSPGYPDNAYDAGPSMTNRRAEGRFGVGGFPTEQQDTWRTNYSATRTYRMSARHPAGLYDISFSGPVAVFTDHWDADRDGLLQVVRVPLARQSLTTIRVRRASSTYLSASSTSFSGPRTITLSGSVRKVQLVGLDTVVNRRSPNTAVKLYFDPAGSRGPVYKKTVRTNSQGSYSTRERTIRSGQWIAKYPGNSVQAPSQRSVTITVR